MVVPMQEIRRYQVYRVRERHRTGFLARLRRLVQALYPPSQSVKPRQSRDRID